MLADGRHNARVELPTGTLTMLFSDMEGSTRLLGRLGDYYADLLSAQRRLLRAAFSAHHGIEMGTEGDSFFVVFASAVEVVGACAASQRALAGHAWPEGVMPQVRMGLHTGEPTRHEDGYVGMDVHRAARISAAAHGGQVVMSEATRQLVAGRLAGVHLGGQGTGGLGPADLGLGDLGWHRLKDIAEPEHLHQALIPGLREAFPPLRSLGEPRQPARAAHALHLAQPGAARCPGADMRGRNGAAGHRHRTRRGREATAGASRRRVDGRPVPGRGLLRAARARDRGAGDVDDDRRDAGHHRRWPFAADVSSSTSPTFTRS
jgi:class 3 adenylate cyclase